MTTKIRFQDTHQLLLFVETLQQRFRWEIPCINEPSDIFEIEKLAKDRWRYRLANSSDWIDCNTLSIIDSLDKNDVNISFFKKQLTQSIFSQVTFCYDIVQDACQLFGEDQVYKTIEDEQTRLAEQVELMLDQQTNSSPKLTVIKSNK